MIDLKLLKTLQALQQTGSLQAAASRLCLTQSALSHQLKDAEHQIGATFFVRKSQPVQFSPQGQLLLALAADVLPKIEATLQQLTGNTQVSTALRLSVECHACFHWLLPAVKAFKKQWPQFQLTLDTEVEYHAVEALVAGELDLVMTTDLRIEDQVAYQPLFELELLAYLYPEHPLCEKSTLHPADLQYEKLLSYPIPLERQDIFRFFFKKIPFKGQQRQVAQATQMLQLVAASEGIAVLPAWLAAPYVSQGLLVTRPLGYTGLKRTMYLVSRRHRWNSACDSLCQLLRQQAPGKIIHTAVDQSPDLN